MFQKLSSAPFLKKAVSAVGSSSLKTRAMAGSLILALVILGLVAQTLRSAIREKALADRYLLIEDLARHLNASVANAERTATSRILASSGDPSDENVRELLEARKTNEEETRQVNAAIEKVLKVASTADFVTAVAAWRESDAAVIAARPKVLERQIRPAEWRGLINKRNEAAFRLRDVAFASTEPRERVVYYNSILRARVMEIGNYLGLQRALLGAAITSELPLSAAQVLTLDLYHQAIWANKKQIAAIKASAATPTAIVSAIEQFEGQLAEAQPVYDSLIAVGTAKTADGGIPTRVVYPASAFALLGKLDDGIVSVSDKVGEASTQATLEMDANSKRFAAQSLLIALSAIAAVAGSVYWFQRRVLGGVLDLATVANKVSAGDMTSRAKVVTRDEIGVLGSSLNSMIESLLALEAATAAQARELNDDLERLLWTANRIEQGDGAARAPKMKKAEVDKFAWQFNSMLDALEYHSRQVESANIELGIANAGLASLTSELQSAKQEADLIFATVKQGLFLLTPDGYIGAQTSEELKTIFQTDELSQRNLFQLLRPLIPEKRHKTVSDYLTLLFNARKNDRQLQKFNPLKRAELSFPRGEGGFQIKHLAFTFQRIIAGGVVQRVLVMVLDVTERVVLEDQLRASEERREKQLELLFELLQVDNAALRQFIESAASALEKINATFMESPKDGEGNPLPEKVHRVFRVAHSLKAEAASVGLTVFEKSVHQIESQLNELRRNPGVVSEDLLNVLISIANFQAQLEEASELVRKVSGLRRGFDSLPHEAASRFPAQLPENASPATELIYSVDMLSKTIAARRGKKVQFEWNIRHFDILEEQERRIVRDAVFQLVRNSIVHGIEPPEIRTSLGKSPSGKISVSLQSVGATDRVQLLFRDDGSGLDVERIREQGVRLGLVPASTAATLGVGELGAFIFHSGFSTAKDVTEDAGRGVGLDLLKSEIVDRLGGEICIKNGPGRYCEFQITIPTA